MDADLDWEKVELEYAEVRGISLKKPSWEGSSVNRGGAVRWVMRSLPILWREWLWDREIRGWRFFRMELLEDKARREKIREIIKKTSFIFKIKVF